MGSRTPNELILLVLKLKVNGRTQREAAELSGLQLGTVRRIWRGELKLDESFARRLRQEADQAAAIRLALREIGRNSRPYGLDLTGQDRVRYMSILGDKRRSEKPGKTEKPE